MASTRKTITLRLRPEHHVRFADAAAARDLTLSAWLVQAALSYEAKGARFAKHYRSADQPTCSVCGHRHAKGAPHAEIRETDPWT